MCCYKLYNFRFVGAEIQPQIKTGTRHGEMSNSKGYDRKERGRNFFFKFNLIKARAFYSYILQGEGFY